MSSSTTWIPMKVNHNGDADDDSEVTQLVYVKKKESRFEEGWDKYELERDRVPVEDKRIVWPPVVIVENTRVGYDKENNKWKGMKKQDIHNFLKKFYNCVSVKIRSLFDYKGQKGCALLVFPKSIEGYLEAEALSKRLDKKSKGRLDWTKARSVVECANPTAPKDWNTPDLVNHRGERRLYGYLAVPDDMHRLDPRRKNVKWFAESYNDKVRSQAHH